MVRHKQTNKQKQRRQISYVELARAKSEATKRTKKKSVCLIGEKNNFALAATVFCTFLCRCFARLERETSRNLIVTRFMEERLYDFLFTFFHRRSFST